MPTPRRQPAELRALRRRAIALLSAGALLVGLASLVSASLTLGHALSPVQFAAMVGEGFERTLRVEAVRLELRPMPLIRAEGVEIEGLGTADAAEVELRWRPLLSRKLRASVVRLEKPRLVLERGPDGDFVPIFRGDGADSRRLSALPRFEAESGELRVVQGERLVAVLRLAALSLSRFDAQGVADLVVAGNLTGGDGRWHVHPLQLRGQLVHGPEGTALRDGRAHARFVGARWWRGRDARARFGYGDGVVQIESLEARGFGGRWRVAGRVFLRGGTRLDVAARADQVDLVSVVEAMSPGSEPGDLGTLRASFERLRVPWRGGPRFEEGTGTGELRVSGGTLPGRSLLASLVGAQASPNPVAALTASVELREARVRSEDVRLETRDYRLEGRGSLGLDRTIELGGVVHFSGAMPSLPVTVAGTLSEPVVDAHPSRLPAGGIGTIASTVGKTGVGVARGAFSAGRRIGGVLGAIGGKALGVFRPDER
jgi:hypothetical protein